MSPLRSGGAETVSPLPGGGAPTPGGRARTLIVLGLLELAFADGCGLVARSRGSVSTPRAPCRCVRGLLGDGVAPRSTRRADTRLIWGFAILFRVVLLPCVPFLSDDIYRYLWDGHVQLAGINPYLYPPDAPELESIRTAWHARINNPSISTIYPPFAQMVFAAGALAGGSLLALKALWTLADLAACLLLTRIARRTGRSVPGRSCSSPGRRCWWSRRPGAATSSPSASFCSWSWFSSPCPRAGEGPPTNRTRPTAVPLPVAPMRVPATPIPFSAMPMPAPPRMVWHRGPGCPGRWARCWPSRPSPSSRPSWRFRRSSAVTGCAWRRRVSWSWSSSISPISKRDPPSGPVSPPTRNTGERTRGPLPSSKPCCRDRGRPATCPACSYSRSWPGRHSGTSTRSGPSSGSSGRGCSCRRHSIPGTRSGFCPSRRCAGTVPGSC